jgi:predicted unusual protein kinase regulating ubiquinone biosynthesis (AarF/ABC1/UbiB family)
LQTPDGKLCYIDFGMMASVSAKRRYALIGAAIGLVNKEVGIVVRNLKSLEFFPPDTNTDTIIAALNIAIANSTEGGEGSTLNFTRLNQNLQSISSLLPFRLPPFYTLIVRTLTILEGLALYVDKDFRLVRGAYPFIAKQLLTSPSPELKELLQSIILDDNGRIRWERLEQFVSISSSADKVPALS